MYFISVFFSTGVSLVAGIESSIGFTNGNASDATFNYPLGIAIDSDGSKLYVCDSGNNAIRIISPVGQTYQVETLTGSGIEGWADGTLQVAEFSSPYGIALGRGGNIYIVDSGNNRIRKIQSSGWFVLIEC